MAIDDADLDVDLEVARDRRGNYVLDADERVRAWVWVPLAEKVNRWLRQYVKDHAGAQPDVDEVAAKEYRGCKVEVA